MKKYLPLLIVWLLSAEVFAAGNGVCRGRQLPRGKDQHWSNHILVCVPEVDHYVRTNYPFDLKKWKNLEWKYQANPTRAREMMQKMRQDEEPLIKWSGRIPYSTVEEWDYEVWEFGDDISCPTHVETYTDSEGKTQTRTTRPPCWHWEEYHGARHCTNETMEFDAEFIRPSRDQWGPQSAGYYDIIPSGYDLLPGEIEDVQIFSNVARARFFGLGRKSTKLEPGLEVGNAWSEYNYSIRFTSHGDQPAIKCKHDNPTKIDVDINWVKRFTDRQTPNTLRIKTDEDGDEVEPLLRLESQNNKGKYDEGRPYKLKLVDVSAEIIKEMARQSRDYTGDREMAKQEAGEGRSSDFDDVKEFESAATDATGNEGQKSFWLDTQIKVRLYEDVFLGRDRRRAKDYFTTSGNALENKKEYQIDLSRPGKDGHTFYRSRGMFSNDSILNLIPMDLPPHTDFYFDIRMFQPGVPFYRQENSAWIGDNRFSEPLNIYFETTGVDQRGTLQKLNDFQGKTLTEKVSSVWRSIFGD